MISFFKNTVFLFPTSGLANRMRVIESGYSLAKKTNKRLFIFWVLDETPSCNFNLLFNSINNTTVLNFKAYDSFSFNHIIYRILFYLLIKIKNIRPLRQTDILYRRENFSKSDNNSYYESEVLKKGFFYKGNADFYFAEKNNYAIFQPVAALENKISAIADTFSENTIGIHIRGTDNMAAKSKSTTALFIDKINLELTKNPKANFFLATDEPATEQLLREKFEGKLITFSTHKDRDSTIGIREALIDLFLLSKTGKIYGSFYSSFSEMASKLNNATMEVVK